jgi:hypothetical protein
VANVHLDTRIYGTLTFGGDLFVSQFYAAATFWAAVGGTIATIVLGLIGTWFASRLAPKRRLSYWISDPVALLTAPASSLQESKIWRNGRVIKDPRLVEVTFLSNGRQSISSESFSQGRPLILDFGVTVVEILKAAGQPAEQAIPDYKLDVSKLKIGPSGIAAKQKIDFSLLVDGNPRINLISNLPDVQVRRQQANADPLVRRAGVISGLAITVIAVIVVVTYIRLNGVSVTVPDRLIAPTPAAARTAAKDLLPLYGWNKTTQFSCLNSLWGDESGWHYNAKLETDGAYGIPLAFPPSQMATIRSDWRTDAITQIRWGLIYIQAQYKTPCKAWAHFKKHGDI